MLDFFERQSLFALLEAYGLYADVTSKHFPFFAALIEQIAGNERLRGLDGNRRKAMVETNRTLLEELITDLDESQEKYEEAVSLPWMGFDGMLAALFLHYATTYILLRRASVPAADAAKLLGRSFQMDMFYLKKWSNSLADLTDSEEKNSNRAKLYTGNARGTFFQAYEVSKAIHYPHGWVAKYVTKDDMRVCSDCNDAAGYYLLTQGPFPGRVCKGRARCRCKRLIVWNPTQHKLLSGAVDVKAGWSW